MVKQQNAFICWSILVWLLLLDSCARPRESLRPTGSPESVNHASPQGTASPIRFPAQYADLQKAIDALPVGGGTILLSAGTHTLAHRVQIRRSDVTLTGEPGTVLKLADGVNQPVLLIGTDAPKPAVLVTNIRISGIEIDGNQARQRSETDPARPWIRNNGIDARMVNGLWLTKMNVHDAKSGGFVASWYSTNVFIASSAFSHNAFDGIALYASSAIQITQFQCNSNGASGLSLDNDLRDVQFSNGEVESNGGVGIFVRHSKAISFRDIVVRKNGRHGCLLSPHKVGDGTGVQGLLFTACSFVDNQGWGLWLASPSSDSFSNTVTASRFADNKLGPIKDDSGVLRTSDCVF